MTAQDAADAGPGGARALDLSDRASRKVVLSNEQDVLKDGLAACRRAFVVVGIFSLAVNILLLTIPIYLFQVSDRVLISQSTDTLIMLTVVAAGALVLLAILDYLRRYVLTRVALQIESTMGGPVFAASLERAAVGADKDIQGLRDLALLRGFLGGPVVPILFDAPMAPLYIAVVYLIHRISAFSRWAEPSRSSVLPSPTRS